MRKAIVENFEKRVSKKNAKLPEFRPGDTINVHYRVRDRDEAKGRIQQFEGVVMRYKKGNAASTFTVRKISANGVGVERVFPIFSQNLERVEVIAKGIVRRARLYYLRDRAGKAARIRSRFGEESADAAAPAVQTSDAPVNTAEALGVEQKPASKKK